MRSPSRNKIGGMPKYLAHSSYANMQALQYFDVADIDYSEGNRAGESRVLFLPAETVTKKDA